MDLIWEDVEFYGGVGMVNELTIGVTRMRL